MSKKIPDHPVPTVNRARLFRLWWPVVAILVGVGLLWSMFPFSVFMKGPLETGGRGQGLPSVPHAAYVRLDPQYAAEALRKIRSAWATDEQSGKLSFEMELVELGNAPKAPWKLEHGARYPGSWKPAEVIPLRQPLPEIGAPCSVALNRQDALPQIPPHLPLRLIYSGTLKVQNFTFVLPTFSHEEPAGSGTFSIETDEQGRVIHLLLLSQRNNVLAQFEQAIFRGTARGAARGELTIEWN